MIPRRPLPGRCGCALWTSLLFLLGAGACSESRTPVTVFHAASLSRALAQVEEAFEARHPGLDLRLEPSGSQVAARKVSELNRRADLVMVADARIIDAILRPDHALFNLIFLSNELVLAYGAHSPYTDAIDAGNWPRLLADTKVRLGRADPYTAPLGFQTLMLWQLAELERGGEAVGGADLAERLAARCRPEHVTPDIAELVSLLESRVIDYAFVFRSMAEEHRLKLLRLSKAVNLSDPARSKAYARAEVKVRLRSRDEARTLVGAPILYGMTVPADAPHDDEARLLLRFLLGPEAGRIFKRSGFTPIPWRVRGQAPAGIRDGGS